MSDSHDRIEALTTSLNSISEALRPRCSYCGTKLTHYWFYGLRGEQFQICPKCHEKVCLDYEGDFE